MGKANELDPRKAIAVAFTALVVVFGGTVTLIVETSPPTSLSAPSLPSPDLPWYPAPFSESTVALPGFNPLVGYVRGNNCMGPSCFEGGTNYSQVPVLSSDSVQPFGIYYVNNASELVEYEIANGSVRVVAPVTLLYQTWTAYAGMLANEFFLSYGYDEALFFGTAEPSSTTVSIETVNLTTGVVHLLNTTLVRSPNNQQPILVGNDYVVVASQQLGARCTGDCPATITGFDLDNGTSWTAAPDLPFFEANNLYWLPQKHQLINVEAHSSLSDRVEQWNESSNAEGEPTFALASTVTVDYGVLVNVVNGIGFNASTDRIAYSAGGGGTFLTYVLGYNTDGLLTDQGLVRYVSSDGGVASTPQILMGQQYVYTGTYVMGGLFRGTQNLFDPWNGTTVPTNEPFTEVTPEVCDASCFLGTYAPNLSYLIDFHASLARNDPFWSVVLAHAP